jgi:hypothetical protein
MLGLVGILGCVGLAVGAVTAVVTGVVSGVIGQQQLEQAEEAAKKQEMLQREANLKAENRAKLAARQGQMAAERNFAKIQAAAGAAIAIEHFNTENALKKAHAARSRLAHEKMHDARNTYDNKGVPVTPQTVLGRTS